LPFITWSNEFVGFEEIGFPIFAICDYKHAVSQNSSFTNWHLNNLADPGQISLPSFQLKISIKNPRNISFMEFLLQELVITTDIIEEFYSKCYTVYEEKVLLTSCKNITIYNDSQKEFVIWQRYHP